MSKGGIKCSGSTIGRRFSKKWIVMTQDYLSSNQLCTDFTTEERVCNKPTATTNYLTEANVPVFRFHFLSCNASEGSDVSLRRHSVDLDPSRNACTGLPDLSRGTIMR